MAQSVSAGRWVLRMVLGLLALLLFVLLIALSALLYLRIPQNAAGLAAKMVCSASFVSGRGAEAGELMAADVLPASGVLSVISTELDVDSHSVSSQFLGIFTRTASLLPERGCVLDEQPDPAAVPYTPAPPDPAPWPAGDAAQTAADAAGLRAVVDAAFEGEGDPDAANTRGVAVVQGGTLLAKREGADLPANAALHGWSMTKTVVAMLAHKRFVEVGLDIETPVVDAFGVGEEPAWVAEWREDGRARITVADLLFMRTGLKDDEGYDATGAVVQMLYGEPDMSAWGADHPLEYPPGSTWEYLSATSNILSAVVRGQFADEQAYLDYPRTALFEPIGVTTATLETDTAGTWVGSSYLWASVTDWARLGQLMLDDGQWQGEQVIPAGWRALAATPAVPEGEGHGYGAQTWLLGVPIDGGCSDYPGVPADTLAMLGHWGQLVAMVPSRDAVVVRLGWTFDDDQFDDCQLISDVLAELPTEVQR